MLLDPPQKQIGEIGLIRTHNTTLPGYTGEKARYFIKNLKDFILIIPYYNNKEGLLRSLSSVRYPQHLHEVIIVDDGSAEVLEAVDLQKSVAELEHIHIIRIPENKGVAVALNRALASLKGRIDFKYIARLDCGDVCVDERFERQVEYLDTHPETGLLGTRVLFRSFETGKEYLYQNSVMESDIRKEMHFKCSFIHPSVMFRRTVFEAIGLYPENYMHCEDYAYFFRIMKEYQSCNLPEVLLLSEISKNGVSAANRRRQLASRMRVVLKFGTEPLLKVAGIFKLVVLFVVPLRTVKYLNTLIK
jgi:glycosyltransferase involved in cell wall biosynthesis